jgi:hypothetical protein
MNSAELQGGRVPELNLVRFLNPQYAEKVGADAAKILQAMPRHTSADVVVAPVLYGIARRYGAD